MMKPVILLVPFLALSFVVSAQEQRGARPEQESAGERLLKQKRKLQMMTKGPKSSSSAGKGKKGTTCFSTSSTVNVENKGEVGILDVKLNDMVLSDQDGTYSKVYAFGHRNSDQSTEMLRIETDSTSMELTANHMLYLQGKTRPVAAGAIQIGDKLALVSANNDDGNNNNEEVRKVEIVKSKGFITPITTSGKIVVDGVVASTYAGKNGSEHYNSMIHYQDITHVAMAPLRFACNWISSTFCGQAFHHDENDEHGHEGQHAFLSFIWEMKHFATSDDCGPVLHALIFAGVVGTGLFFYMLENMLWTTTVLLGALLVLGGVKLVSAKNNNKNNKAKML